MKIVGADRSIPEEPTLQALKAEALGRMASGLAHDLNNFLLVILGNSDLLARDLGDRPGAVELIDEIRAAAGRAADLCTRLVDYTGRVRIRPQALDLSAVVRSMVPMLKVAIAKTITLRLELDDSVPLVVADQNQIHQALMNLVVNAAEAIGPRNGTVTIATGMLDAEPGPLEFKGWQGVAPSSGLAFLEVRDTGPGVDPALRPRIFDPFFSTKLQGRGLGLASVMGMVRSHGGGLALGEGPDGETVFRVLFQLGPKPAQAPPWSPRRGRGRPGRVLLIDDDPHLCALGARMIRRLGWEVATADDGRRGIDLVSREGDTFGCVILNLVMPGMDGVDVRSRLAEIDPDLPVVISSGYDETEIAVRFAGAGLAGFLQKPYVLADLARTLDAILDPVNSREAPGPGS